MDNKEGVKLIRKQGTPFTVNYPHDGRVTTYTWMGTKGSVLNERPVPYEVFEWLQNNTTTFSSGCLIIKKTKNEEVNMIKENIEDIDKIEKAILSKKEVIDMLTTGNHLVLKKKLNELIKDKPENIIASTKQYIIGIATDVGIDSSSKRKVICEWAGINYENNDLFFDKNLKEMYKEEK